MDNKSMPYLKAPLKDTNVSPITYEKTYILHLLKVIKSTCFLQSNSPDQSQHLSQNPQLVQHDQRLQCFTSALHKHLNISKNR